MVESRVATRGVLVKVVWSRRFEAFVQAIHSIRTVVAGGPHGFMMRYTDGSVRSFALTNGVTDVELIARRRRGRLLYRAGTVASIARRRIAVITLFARLHNTVAANGG